MAAFKPWYITSGNKHVRTYLAFDIDRAGMCYRVTVYESLNKRGETVSDVIKVVHLGPVTAAKLVQYGGGECFHKRFLESEDCRLYGMVPKCPT